MNEKYASHPFMTMILTSVTMVGWADVPDSDRGDFRRRRAVDISSFPNFSSLSKHTLAIEYHVYIRQVSPQLSCGGTCQI